MKSNTQSTWRKVPRTVGLYQYLSNKIYYVMVRRSGRLYHESLKTTDLAFAKRKLEAYRSRLDRTNPTKGRMTFVHWLEKIYWPTQIHGAENTLKKKRCIIARVRETWVVARTSPMRDLRPSDVSGWLAREFGSGTGAYYNAALMVIRAAFKMAVADKAIYENPAANVEWRKQKKPIRLTPTFEQFQTIIADVRSQRFNADAEDSGDFLEFMGLAGLGQAEVSVIKRCHVDLGAQQIAIYRQKTTAAFIIPIYPQLRPLIEKLCEGKKPNEDLFAIGQARKALTNVCIRLDLPNFTQRSLRRMFITRAIERGVDVKVIAQWQGHKDGGKMILETYSHVRPEHSNRMAALMTTEETPANVVPMQAKQ